MESEDEETIEFEIEVVESSSSSSLTSNLEKEEQQQQHYEEAPIEFNLINNPSDNELLTLNVSNEQTKETQITTNTTNESQEEKEKERAEVAVLHNEKSLQIDNDDKIIFTTSAGASTTCDDASNTITTSSNVPILQEAAESIKIDKRTGELNTNQSEFSNNEQNIQAKPEDGGTEKAESVEISTKEDDNKNQTIITEMKEEEEVKTEMKATTSSEPNTLVNEETKEEVPGIPLLASETSQQQEPDKTTPIECSCNTMTTNDNDNNKDIILKDNNESSSNERLVLEEMPETAKQELTPPITMTQEEEEVCPPEPIKLSDCKLVKEIVEELELESVELVSTIKIQTCEEPSIVKSATPANFIVDNQQPQQMQQQHELVQLQQQQQQQEPLKIEITTEELDNSQESDKQNAAANRIEMGSLNVFTTSAKNDEKQQSKPRRRPSVIDIDLAPNEDLEWEFDNEPPFEERHVVVKRNQNPRLEYELSDELGRGRFGTVYKCIESSSGRRLAAKFIHMRRKEDREDVEREVSIMSSLQHRRLLQLYDAFDDNNKNEMCLITELVEGGELFERIVDNDFELTEKKAAIFMRQICEGVQYMHSKSIVHLDMKPENILCLSKTCNRIKLIDFGLARELKPNQPLRVMFGTPDFAAPEVLGYDVVTLATDMWSVGVICYVLLSGLSPFMGDNDMDTMANVTRATYDFDDEAFDPISDLAKDFISKLLVKEPLKRLKPEECLKHSWLQRGGKQLEVSARNSRRQSMINMMTQQRLSISGNNDPSSGLASGGLTREDLLALEAIAEQAVNSTPPVVSLDKRNLKKYVVRRKWHKTVHAIMALGRMGANLKLHLSTTTTTNTKIN